MVIHTRKWYLFGSLAIDSLSLLSLCLECPWLTQNTLLFYLLGLLFHILLSLLVSLWLSHRWPFKWGDRINFWYLISHLNFHFVEGCFGIYRKHILYIHIRLENIFILLVDTYNLDARLYIYRVIDFDQGKWDFKLWNIAEGKSSTFSLKGVVLIYLFLEEFVSL